MSIVPGIHPDDELEAGIEIARRRLLDAHGEEAQRAAWTLMRALLCQRSPERIAHMELERGLR